ncbi:MAG: hypothetical protein ACREVY_00100 [Gammaproteobacteria bacterium]
MTYHESVTLGLVREIQVELREMRGEIKAAIESLDARLKVLEEERRRLDKGILKMREEDRQEQAAIGIDDEREVGSSPRVRGIRRSQTETRR